MQVIVHCLQATCFVCAESDSYTKQHFVPVKVTLIPFIGFHFSRCSYVLSLLRPHIYEDLELKVSIAQLRNEEMYTLKVIWKSMHFGFCVRNSRIWQNLAVSGASSLKQICSGTIKYILSYLILETWAEGLHEGPPCF